MSPMLPDKIPPPGKQPEPEHTSQVPACGKAIGKAGKAKTSDVEALRAELKAGDMPSPSIQEEEESEAAQS